MNFRRNLLVSMALLTTLTAPALAQKEPPVKLSLSQLKPSEMVQILLESREPKMLPDGIQMISPDDENRHLLIQGTPEGVNHLREIIRLMDVRQKTLRLEARILLQNPAQGTNKSQPEVVATATIQMTNNRQGEVVLLSQGRVFRFQITPHINGDGTFTLFTRFTDGHLISEINGSYRHKKRESSGFRRMKGGVAEVIAGFSLANEPPVDATLEKNTSRPETAVEVNAPMFLLEVTPVETSMPVVSGQKQAGPVTKRQQPGQRVK
jgi:hypothetical protein